MADPTLAVIIVNWNTRELLARCLEPLAPAGDGPTSPADYALWVVDNGSMDGSAEMVQLRFPGVHLLRNARNVGYARANNQGIRASQSRHVLLLNSDAIATPNALGRLARFLDAHPDVGAVGPRLLRPDRTPQPYAFGGDPTLAYLLRRAWNRLVLRQPVHDWGTDETQEVDWVSGAAMAVRRDAIDEVGLLDEAIFMYFEDNDWCLRMRQAGWRVCYVPEVEVTHLGGASVNRSERARAAYRQSLLYFYRKHYGALSRLALRLLLPLYDRLRPA
jgi:hypothetical protein